MHTVLYILYISSTTVIMYSSNVMYNVISNKYKKYSIYNMILHHPNEAGDPSLQFLTVEKKGFIVFCASRGLFIMSVDF